ncbi:putative alpha-1,2-mannosidase [Saccharopolyspora gloriosae]|uniref:Putative alpha-1,2-mannosidase n=1 Tax=Saccharopolyspora gloriosae TaxID=455344 RepID=A0A840NA95_9PSEU|nr:GH92 family glycosyl hydrolase [Saccharopolyspora gloriosae]MBB5068880.1 putative alpha-1,2-mannosidase [Saccharopolyspora gloriosae]
MRTSRRRRTSGRYRSVLVTTVGLVTALALPAAAVPAVAAAPAAPDVEDPAQYVNPFTGTQVGGPDFGHGGGAGNTFPGAVAPFGMMQWSPDTAEYQHGGYQYDDDRIRGFSLTHLSGAGCGDFGNIPFLPVLGDAPAQDYAFSHESESASPGAYDVTFDNGLRTELTATQRAGIAKFTYPEGQTASLSVDAAKAFNDASGSLTVEGNSISGYTDGGGFCGGSNKYRIYFHAEFDKDFTGSGVVRDGQVDPSTKEITGSARGAAPAEDGRPAPRDDGAQAFVSFDPGADRTVTARVGMSFVSLDGAKANATEELGERGFGEVRDGTRAAWNDMLGRIDVGGGEEQDKRRLYTGLYHSLLHPNVFSDVNGEYTGFDGQVRSAEPGHAQYANYSGWDVYRSQMQLVSLIAPDIASDIAQSAVNQSAQGGYFDRWTVANGGTGVMTGDPLPIMIASAHAFGATDFDTGQALERMVAGASNSDERPAHDQYGSLGYIAADDEESWGSVSTTLEYTAADFAVAQFAQRIGQGATHDEFQARAQNWQNLLNPDSGWIQPRAADGSWPEFDLAQQDGYVEGNAAQYTWMVPFNHRELFDRMGGDEAVTGRLDEFFAELNGGPDKANAYLGNEPSANTPWAYAYAGQPHKTQDVVRRALTDLFSAEPNGLVGNDDLGQMSSWAVWASLGMYPEAPGRAELVLASPLFSSISIDRGDGRTIEVNAPEASRDTEYVQGLAVNGAPSGKAWLSEEFVNEGGTLDYALGAEPNTEWGSAPEDAPPSFGAPGE